MRANTGGELPKELLRGHSRFQAWRRHRRIRGRIPDTLWALAVRLVNRHGLNSTARALGLDYYSLKKRAQEAADPAPARGPAFVELPSPVLVGKRALFELDNGTGATLRLHLVGYEAADVATLARTFWNAD